VIEIPAIGDSDRILADCLARGLRVEKLASGTTTPGSRNWQVKKPGAAGTLEVAESHGMVTLRVAESRDGGWAADLASELAGS
jgi:hypothetical protein